VAFKKIGVILGTEGLFRKVVQIKIGTSTSIKFNLLEWKKLHQLHPQNWVVIHTHPPEIGVNLWNDELYEMLELVIAPYHSLFVIYQPGIGDFVFRYENSFSTGEYDTFENRLKNVILPDSEFQEPLCEGLELCFHLDFLVRRSPMV